MRVSTNEMRRAVAGWLREEKATVVQALELQSAVEAGAIAGWSYAGKRVDEGEAFTVVDNYQRINDARPTFGSRTSTGIDSDKQCGCLVDTFERIEGGRRVRGVMGEDSSETFALALLIGLGDTPENSRWAKAAVKGIEDYVAEKEAQQ